MVQFWLVGMICYVEWLQSSDPKPGGRWLVPVYTCAIRILTTQAAINAAFADDGELLFVGASENAAGTNLYDGANVPTADPNYQSGNGGGGAASPGAGGRPSSAARKARPDSARARGGVR
jgi:hypothetical protein